MKEYILNYYPDFKCVANECKHTCCAGWEMNIDDKSLRIYLNDKSSFCDALKKGINLRKSSFRMDKKGRCAFLNHNGLCEIIINLGEEGLCQVCRDHPRFRTFLNDRIEMGLGSCCEEATRIILSFNDKIMPLLLSDDGKVDELDFNQKNILEFREKALAILQDRKLDINLRITNLLSLCNARIQDEDMAKIVKLFLSFQRLDKSWFTRLKFLKKNGFIHTTDTYLAHYAEQFLVNSLYRHLYDAADTFEVRARAIACVFGWWIINGIFKQEQATEVDDFNKIIDVVRAYSAEVEYSQKNLEKLFLFAYKFIKI